MGPENSNSNWLSFSLSPTEMLTSTTKLAAPFGGSSPDNIQNSSYYFADNNFYANDWENSTSNKFQSLYMESNHQNHPVPKLEDFLGGDSALVRYSDSQTDTQDSSLTHMYDSGVAGSAYFSTIQEGAVNGFQAFSNHSGSEVDDSASMGRAQLACSEFAGQSVESGDELAGFAQCQTGALSLGVTNNHNTEKAIVPVESDGCKKISDTFGLRTSIYRGVTRHRWTGRFEAHLWDNSCRREGQARKGRQVYLGGYDKEDKAARAYDLAALKYWGASATTNFPVSSYSKELEEMKTMTKQEFIASLRRKSSGFSRGASIYRGVTRHHQQGRWQARIGRVAGNKDLYLGTFATEEEAAEAYDIAAIKFRGVNAVTNFEMNRYDVEAIMKSNLPIGGAAKRLKLSLESEQSPSLNADQHPQCSSRSNGSTNIDFSTVQPLATVTSGLPFYQNLLHGNSNGAPTPGSSASAASNMVTPVNFLQSSQEFYIWPHQSY